VWCRMDRRCNTDKRVSLSNHPSPRFRRTSGAIWQYVNKIRQRICSNRIEVIGSIEGTICVRSPSRANFACQFIGRYVLI
jgi:hypothetical protein